MSDERLVWQSPCGNTETVRDGAERFVREVFDTDRRIRWLDGVGEFMFADGYWCYRISCIGGVWEVHRTNQLTPAAKKRVKARREARNGR